MHHSRKVLLVDDSEVVRSVVRTQLESLGFRVVTLDSPLGFARSLQTERPDAVLLDVSMPLLTGDRLLAIAAGRRIHRCPVLLFSNRPDVELQALVLQSGAAGFVRKGVNPHELAHAIESACQAGPPAGTPGAPVSIADATTASRRA